MLRAWGIGGCVLSLLAAPSCGGESPPPLVTGDPSETREPAEGEEVPAPKSRLVKVDGLWFSGGLGRDALLAREQRDYAKAAEKLDALLARDDLDAGDRGAAHLLRGIEHRRADRFEAAAADFAKARTADALEPIHAWIAMQQARANLAAGQPEPALEALAIVERSGADQPALGPELQMARANALSRTGDPAGAEAAYRAFLKDHTRHARRFEARTRLAELIEDKKPAEAVDAYETVLAAVPLSEYGEDAREGLARLAKAGHAKRKGKHFEALERAVALAELEARLDRRQYRAVVESATKYLRRKDTSPVERCRAAYAKGSAVFKQRKRAEARPHYEQAIRLCDKAKDDDRVVKSRYQAARGLYAAGKYEEAAKAFESLATDHADHTYADDALVLAGESWASADAADKAKKSWLRAVDEQPNGDMHGEIQRRLLVQAFADKRYDEVLDLVDKALAHGNAHPEDQAKAHYFRGRALAALGRADEAQQSWVAAVRTMPLSYPAVQALSRLREAGEAPLAKGLAALEGGDDGASAEAVSLALPHGRAAVRAQTFARLGLGDEARAELDTADVGGWPAAAVLAQAGLYDASQRTLANLGARWRGTPPVGPVRAQYEVAHPTPFAEIIEPGEARHDVQPLLTFAVMQTESRFNPAATSWAGARGLVQLMPKTAEGLARGAGVSIDETTIYDPGINLDLGMRYLSRLEARWGRRDGAVALAVSSYNAGAGNVDKWLGERGGWDLDLFIEAIPFDETRRYTQHVIGRWMAYRYLYGEGQPSERLPYLPLDIPERD